MGQWLQLRKQINWSGLPNDKIEAKKTIQKYK
jgi:hypothetical protein